MDDVFFMIYCFCKNFLFYNKFSNIYLIDTVTVVFFFKKNISGNYMAIYTRLSFSSVGTFEKMRPFLSLKK